MQLLWLALAVTLVGPVADDPQPRRPADETSLKSWLENMVWYHRYSVAEIEAATGLGTDEVVAALKRFKIRPDGRPTRPAGSSLVVLPYPGGRHPRIGFLEGAVNPQRETKVSVFLPWDPASYVVADIPEAIWSQLGLTYLAHTHVPTIWDKEGRVLEPLEWRAEADGSLVMERTLPNGIRFGTKVVPGTDAVRMEQWLHNGTSEPLSDLRVQNCVMLKGAPGFDGPTNANKVFRAPYAACHDESGKRWVISAWVPSHRVWGNEPVPCLHADPKFPDCPRGRTVRLAGWLSFYVGDDLDAELERIEATGWHAGSR